MIAVRRWLGVSTCILTLASIVGCVGQTGGAARGGASGPPIDSTAPALEARPDEQAAPEMAADQTPDAPATTQPQSSETEKQPAPPPAPPAQREVLAMIEQAAQLTFSSERADVLGRVAARTDLTEADQIALIDAACQLGFSEHITSVLLTLAQNPMLTSPSRNYLLEKSACIPFSSQRKRVVDVLTGEGR